MEGFHAAILYRFHCRFRCHGCAIGIAGDFTAAQIHDRRQISPSFFLHMDAGNICAPFWIDGFCSKITFQDIHFIIRDTAVTGMAAVLLYYRRAQSLPCHMPPDPLDAAGCSLGVAVSSCDTLTGENCFTRPLIVLRFTPYSRSGCGYEVPPALYRSAICCLNSGV